MTELLVQQVVASTPIIRKCGHCRQIGHTINACSADTMLKLVQKAYDAANYSLAFQPSSQYLNAWIQSESNTHLNAIASKFGIRGRRGTTVQQKQIIQTALIEILYTTHAHLEDGTAAAVPLNLRALAAINASDGALIRIDEHMSYIFANTFRQFEPTNDRERQLERDDLIRLYRIRRKAAERRVRISERAFSSARNYMYNARVILDNIIEFQEVNRLLLPPPPRKFAITSAMLCTETVEELAELQDCSICYDAVPTSDMITLNCSHEFCKTCLTNYLVTIRPTKKSPCCALCRVLVKTLTFRNVEFFQEMTGEYCLPALTPIVGPTGASIDDIIDE